MGTSSYDGSTVPILVLRDEPGNYWGAWVFGDAVSYLWPIRRGDEDRLIQVYISRTALMSEELHLPREVAQAKETDGRSAVVTLLALDDPPEEVMVTTAGISLSLPD